MQKHFLPFFIAFILMFLMLASTSVTAIFTAPQSMTATKSYENKLLCPHNCDFAGFVCCAPGTGLHNHYKRYDAPDAIGECWASCGTKTALVIAKEKLPDFIIEKVELHGVKGYNYLTALIKNQGTGSFENKKGDDKKVRVDQSIQEYPFRSKNKERTSIDYYRIQNYGAWKVGDSKWSLDLSMTAYALIPEQTYLYSIQINGLGLTPESNTENNEFKAKIRLTKDGSLVVGRI